MGSNQINEDLVTTIPSSEMTKACQYFIDQKTNAVFSDIELFFKHVIGREYPEVAPISEQLRNSCDIRTEKIKGYTVYTFTPKKKRSEVHIIYTHGGGWVHELIAPHWDMIHQLIEDNGAMVTVPIYPLSPESNHKVAYEFLGEVYRNVIAVTPVDKVILSGDSAGGGLAIGQCFYFRDLGLPLPKLVVAFSPCVDMTLENPEMSDLEKMDVILGLEGGREAARMWINDVNPKSPILSPLYGDLTGLPPIRIYIGTYDMLLPDNRLFKKKMKAAGGDIQLYEYTGGIHVFMAFPPIPESQDVFKKVKNAITEIVKTKD
ncbi:alpha/beta hydrolase [Chryseobacterium sp. IT-36CA2]|uniref:alpha/beta hydrolase n=1 Tax=Chryseobacterium sp. IT-36CA2 TaxID=3026460 RepID=UPI0039DF9A16